MTEKEDAAAQLPPGFIKGAFTSVHVRCLCRVFFSCKGIENVHWCGRGQTVKRANVTYFLDGAHNIDSMEVQGWGRAAGECECVCLCHGVTLCLICQVCYQWFKEASKREAKTRRCLHVHVCTLSPNTSDDYLPCVCVCVSGRQGCTVCWCST